jgi:hypothetical protein
MARIEEDKKGQGFINVSETVGVNGVNDPDDVMVVQGMLLYLTQITTNWTNDIPPEPNGELDKSTQTAIFDYQQFVRSQPGIFWVAKDGSISPFKKGARLLHKQQLTITALNRDCAKLSAELHDGEDHIDAITKRYPLVGVALGRVDPLFLERGA